MKIPYKILIITGILIEIILLLFFENEVIVNGPIVFWSIGVIIILNYGINIIKLSNSVKRTKPEVFKEYSIGIMLTRYALSDEKFLSMLDDNEKKLLEDSRNIFKYLVVCFILFAFSALLIAIK